MTHEIDLRCNPGRKTPFVAIILATYDEPMDDGHDYYEIHHTIPVATLYGRTATDARAMAQNLIDKNVLPNY